MPSQTNERALEKRLSSIVWKNCKNKFCIGFLLDHTKQLFGKGGIDGHEIRMIIFKT